jgi:hypothetical protein
MYEQMKLRLPAAGEAIPLLERPGQIVDEIIALTKTGLDGIVLSWVNYQQEMRQWIAEIMLLIDRRDCASRTDRFNAIGIFFLASVQIDRSPVMAGVITIFGPPLRRCLGTRPAVRRLGCASETE